MARMPGTRWQGERSPETPMSRYDIVCVHTIVGYAPAHAAHFSTHADGTIDQSRDTAYRSAANVEGNHRIIAIENEDHGPAFGGTPRLPEWVPLTDAQVEACAQILAWAHTVHGVPLQLCPDSRPGSRGLAYHRQGIDGNYGEGTDYPNTGRVPGGETWSTSPGKVCPSDVRIDQLPTILARAIELTHPPEDIDIMDKDTKAWLAQRFTTIRKGQREIAAGTADLLEIVADIEGLTADTRKRVDVAKRRIINAVQELHAADAEDAEP